MAKSKNCESLPPPSPPNLVIRLGFFESFKTLSYEEAGRLFMALMEYAISRDHSVELGREAILFPMLKADRDIDFKSWIRKVEANRENGQKGGRPPKAKTNNAVKDNKEDCGDEDNDLKDEENPENPLGFSQTQKTPYTNTDTIASPIASTLSVESVRSEAVPKHLTDYGDLEETTNYAKTNIRGFTEANAQEIVTLMTRGNIMAGELIRYAIDEACGAGKVDGWGYTHAILERYRVQKFRTLQDALEDNKCFRKAKHTAVTGSSNPNRPQPKVKFLD